MNEEIEKAKRIAFRFISYRMRSCWEVEEKLKKKGFLQNTIKTVITDLKRINYLNDVEFARAFVEARLTHNPKGKFLLKGELQKKGVDKKIAEEVIEEKMSSEEEKRIARKLAERVWEKKKNLQKIKRKAQTYHYLARRGFSSSLIEKIIEEISI